MNDHTEAPIPLAPAELHRVLAWASRQRLTPGTPGEDRSVPDATLALEEHFLADECARVEPRAAIAPKEPDAFRAWFEDLRSTGPGQDDPLFDFLAESADREQMRWFLAQEAAGEAGFDDLVALTQVKLPERPKLEMAKNYWDEMGRGRADAMHGPMLTRLGDELKLGELEIEPVWESLALANLMAGFALQRTYAYHSVGALGVVELTAPGRCSKVTAGLERLGIDASARKYYALHSNIDVVHSRRWNDDVIDPLVVAMPEVSTWIAQGALARLFAGKRTFDRYRIELGLSTPADTTIRRLAPSHASAR
jgi:hypothetical protein